MLRTITPPEPFLQAAIRAELTSSDTCAALGVTAVSATPILDLARKLIEAGYDPNRPLHAYRGDTLAVIVRSIGQAAAIEIDGRGIGFTHPRRRRTAPSVRFEASAGLGAP